MRITVSLVAVTGLLLTGCASGGGAAPGGAPGAGGEVAGTLTVLAAASLTDAFAALGERLAAEHPELDVQFTFAGSAALATQLGQGAPADVLATADEVQMARVREAGLVAEPEVFAQNRLVLAVPPGNPAGIGPPEAAGVPGLADLLPGELTLAVCAPEVPCGAAAAEVLEAGGSGATPDTYEDDVRAVLTKVELGEVDAGLVYLSDVRSAGDRVLAYAFEESAQAVNRYPIAVAEDARNPVAAQAFVDLVLAPEGQRVLADAGLQAP